MTLARFYVAAALFLLILSGLVEDLLVRSKFVSKSNVPKNKLAASNAKNSKANAKSSGRRLRLGRSGLGQLVVARVAKVRATPAHGCCTAKAWGSSLLEDLKGAVKKEFMSRPR